MVVYLSFFAMPLLCMYPCAIINIVTLIFYIIMMYLTRWWQMFTIHCELQRQMFHLFKDYLIFVLIYSGKRKE